MIFMESTHTVHTAPETTATRPPAHRNPRIVIPVVVGLLLVAIGVAARQLQQANQNNSESAVQGEVATSTAPTPVGVMVVGEAAERIETVSAAGVVTAQSAANINSRTNGTVTFLGAFEGMDIAAGELIAQLSNPTLNANLASAQIARTNALQNLSATQNSLQQTIRQAEIGVQNAQAQVQNAEIGVQSARDNLQNSEAVQEQNRLDQKQTALDSYDSHLNAMRNAMDQVDYVIDAEDTNNQLANVEAVLSVKNPGALERARRAYTQLQETYAYLAHADQRQQSALIQLQRMEDGLSETAALVSHAIDALDATITSTNFTAAQLSAQQSTMIGLRSSVLGTKREVQATINGLETLPLAQQQEIDRLKSALAAAQKQYDIARIGLDNAQANVVSAQSTREQQLTGAQNAVASAEAQIAIIQAQLGDLNITAPISGEVIEVGIEEGEYATPGAFIVRIATTDLVTIEIALPQEDVARIAVGQEAYIPLQTTTEETENEARLTATVSRIGSVANEQSKKVTVEIAYDNKTNALIPGTFVEVEVPLAPQAGSNDIIRVPLKAVTIGQAETYVYVIENDMATPRSITLGETSGETVSVIAGLTAGDTVITEGARNVEAGEAVEVQ